MGKVKKIEIDVELEEVLAGMKVSAATKDEVRRISKQMTEVGQITAGDRKQLREYASLATRMEMTDEIIIKAMGGDPKVFLRLSQSRDAQAVLLRGIMRDMKVTRIAAAPKTTESAASKKADQKSGSDWEGIL
jgi:hypothetical protein